MTTSSDNTWPWDALGIESNADERAVRRAYAKLLKQQRPDEDADAFQRLRYAYESALQIVSGNTVVAMPATVSTPTLAVQTVREPDAFESAVQLWQDFVAQPDQLASRRSLEALFDSIVNIPTREELEWQALCHCLNEDTPAELRMNLNAVLGWRDNTAHLRRRNAPIANLALDRVFIDADRAQCSVPRAPCESINLARSLRVAAWASAATLRRADRVWRLRSLRTSC